MKKLTSLFAAVAIATAANAVSAETWCMPGSYQGWSLETNHFESAGDGTYTQTIPDLYGEFKIVKYGENVAWDNSWGNNGSQIENGVNYYANKGGNNIDLAGDNLHYINAKVTITPGENDALTIHIQAERIDEVWCMPGTYQGWSLEKNLFEAVGDGSYTQTIADLYGDFKIIRLNEAGNWNDSWGTNGGTVENGVAYNANKGGDNIYLAGDNLHYINAKVTITRGEGDALTILVQAERVETGEETWHLVGEAPLAWNFEDAPKFEKGTDNVWTLAYIGTISGEFKIVNNASWDNAYSTHNPIHLDHNYPISTPENTDQNMSPADGPWENPTFTVVDNGDAGIVLSVTIQDPSGVEAIEAAEAVKGEAVYFNLQGQRVANPESGLYIRLQDGKATKVAF